MIYFFYGGDNFRTQQRLAELRAGLANSDANLDVRRRAAAELTPAELNDLVWTQSLLSLSTLVIIDRPITDGTEAFKAELTKLLNEPLPNGVVLVLVEDQPDQRTKLFKLLSKFIVEVYSPLKLSEAKRWLQAQAKDQGAQLTEAAASSLAANFSGDLWRMSSELTKLATFSLGQPIDNTAVDQLTPRPLTDNIFAAIEALAQKNFVLVNRLINQQLSVGMSEQQLIAMIAYQFRNLVLIRAWLDRGAKFNELSAKTGLHPYVVQKTADLSRRFSVSDIARVFHLLQRVDTAIKQGKTPPRVGLDILTAQIVSA